MSLCSIFCRPVLRKVKCERLLYDGRVLDVVVKSCGGVMNVFRDAVLTP